MASRGMEEAREYAAVEAATDDPIVLSARAKKTLQRRTRLTPQAARLALDTPPKSDGELHPDQADAPLLPAIATATPADDGTQSTEQSLRKRRAIFSDDADDGDDEHTAHVFSVDATAVAVETRMQPEREGIVPRSSRESRAPHRARRVLNLMDRLEPDDASDKDSKVESDDAQDDGCARRRTWKRRLAETTTHVEIESSTSILFPPPSLDRRSAFARSHSSHSVFLAPPKMSFARSTSSPGDDPPSKSGSASVASVPHALVLPTVRSRSHPDLNVISPQTVAALLRGEYSDRLDSYSLIDCRFAYEYAGGCLKGAVSMNDPAQVEERFLRAPPQNSSRTALIFYCEFSANRAPKMLRHVRNLDRWIHAERYPELFYPELYLIDGGYKNCFETLKDELCNPALYQTMSDKAFVDQCKQGFAAHRTNWKLHKSNACASKFQQLHRHPHDVFHDDSGCGSRHDSGRAHPLDLRSFSQQL